MPRITAMLLAALTALTLAECTADKPSKDDPTPATTSARQDPFAGVDPEIRDFLPANEKYPFGQAGEGAPPENTFFAALVGVWSCRIRFNEGGGRVRYGYPATWAFKYAAGGHAIEHLYFQRKASLPPPLAPIGRDFYTVAFVLYDPAIEAWRFVGVSNIAGATPDSSSQVMTGHLTDDALTFQPDAPRPGPRTKDTFHSVEADEFVWTQYESADRGRTWAEAVSIVCNRRA